MNIVTVGVSGVTNGGKTTLCTKLLNFIPSQTKLIKQDDYFLPENSPLHVPCPGITSHHNWDIISSIDMDAMMRDIQDINSNFASDNQILTDNTKNSFACFFCKNQDIVSILNTSISNIVTLAKECKNHKMVLLIEGFSLFDDYRIKDICNLKFFLTLPKKECFTRRQIRTYNPPDPPGYFEKCVWPMYEAYYERVKDIEGIQFLDGNSKPEDILEIVLRKILIASILS